MLAVYSMRQGASAVKGEAATDGDRLKRINSHRVTVIQALAHIAAALFMP